MSKRRKKSAAGKRSGSRKALKKTLNRTSKSASSKRAKAAPRAAKARPKVKATRGRSAKAAVVSRASQPGSLEQYIDAAAAALDLPIDPAWMPAIKTNLEVTLRFAKQVTAFPLPDESEPAPVFVA